MGGRRAFGEEKWICLCENIFAMGRNLNDTNGWIEAVLTTTAQSIALDAHFVEAYRLTSFASTHGAEMRTSLLSSVTFTPGCSRKNRISEAGSVEEYTPLT
jgi:hypothetical protein